MPQPRPSRRIGRVSARTGKPLEPGQEEAKPSGRKTRRAFRAAEKSAEFFDHLRAHYRETRRTPVNIQAQVKIMLADGTVFDQGEAVIENVSPSGALLGNVKLARNVYPAAPFKLELILQSGEYQGIGIEARPVRFVPESSGLGVKFEEIFVSA